MNNHEKTINGREYGREEIEKCKKAIALYLSGMAEFRRQETTDELKDFYKKEALNNAKFLATQSDGLRLGAPGWPHAKLRYDTPGGEEEKYFFIAANGMDKEKFKEWQTFIGKKFEDNNLNFFYF